MNLMAEKRQTEPAWPLETHAKVRTIARITAAWFGVDCAAVVGELRKTANARVKRARSIAIQMSHELLPLPDVWQAETDLAGFFHGTRDEVRWARARVRQECLRDAALGARLNDLRTRLQREFNTGSRGQPHHD